MYNVFARIRILPLTIFAATFMLTIKVSFIVQGLGALTPDVLETAQASAQTIDESQLQPVIEAPDSQDSALNEVPTDNPDELPSSFVGENEAQEKSESHLNPFEIGEDLVDAEAEKIINNDPTFLTLEEIAILERLKDRRVELDSREREIEQRSGLLKAAETRIDDKIRQLQAFQKVIEGLIKTYDGQQEQKMLSLVKIYENMKPKEAARIFEELAMDTLLAVVERMKERKLAAVMAKMNPQKARDVTVELSRLRELPDSGSTDGG